MTSTQAIDLVMHEITGNLDLTPRQAVIVRATLSQTASLIADGTIDIDDLII